MARSDVAIRPAVPADADAVWPLVSAMATSFVPERDRFGQAFAAVAARADAVVLVAEADRRLVGYLLGFVHPTFFANSPVGWVEELMVAEEWRRAGVGRRLMVAAEDWARSRGAAYVALASRRAGDFYRAIGYQESATFYRKLISSGPPAGT